MEHVREIARSIIAEMEGNDIPCDISSAEQYRKLAIIDYSKAIKESPFRSPEINERAFEEAYLLAEKAISLGLYPERMDKSLYHLRQYWVKRLKESN